MWPGVLGALALAAMPGCIIIADDDVDTDTDTDPNPNNPAEVEIQEGAYLNANPGEGIGVFIEYAGEGRWNFWSTCDTELSGITCGFDVFINGSNIDVVEDIDLEGLDYVTDDGSEIHAFFDNDFDVDGITVAAGDDAPLTVEVWIDGAPNGEYVFWAADDVIYQGLPTNPTVFIPGDAATPPVEPEQVGIDEGATFDVDPGTGVGIYPEYLGAGQWNFWTTCDTETSGFTCQYDLVLTGSNLAVIEDIDLEGADWVESGADDISAYFDNGVDVDGITVVGDDGAPITLQVWIDGEPNSDFVFWIDGGNIYQGMPSNPATFVPNLL